LSLCTTCSVKTTNGNITGQVRVADNNVYSLTQTYTGTGTKKSSQTQVAGIDTFVAGQILSGYINFDTFVGTLSRVWLVVEVEFNI